jgi:hypothetical protein
VQSTALSLGLDAVLRRYVDRLSRHARDAHLQLTANRIFVARDNGRLSEVTGPEPRFFAALEELAIEPRFWSSVVTVLRLIVRSDFAQQSNDNKIV